MLIPNPVTGSISRVVALADDGDRVWVVDIGPFYQNPKLFKPLNPGYTFAILFWKWIAGLLLITSIAASFFWHWWAFLVGGAVGYVIERLNRGSTGDFITQALRENEKAGDYFMSLKLVWLADKARVVPDGA